MRRARSPPPGNSRAPIYGSSLQQAPRVALRMQLPKPALQQNQQGGNLRITKLVAQHASARWRIPACWKSRRREADAIRNDDQVDERDVVTGVISLEAVSGERA